jgi:hypothetical protein
MGIGDPRTLDAPWPVQRAAVLVGVTLMWSSSAMP